MAENRQRDDGETEPQEVRHAIRLIFKSKVDFLSKEMTILDFRSKGRIFMVKIAEWGEAHLLAYHTRLEFNWSISHRVGNEERSGRIIVGIASPNFTSK